MKNPNLFPNGKRFGFFLCGGGNVTLCELFGQFASRRLRVHDKVEVGLGVRTP